MKFKDTLKSLRKSLSYTQKEFAQVLGLSQQALSDLERGKNNPSKTLVRFLEYRYGDKSGRSTLSSAISDKDIPDDIKEVLEQALAVLTSGNEEAAGGLRNIIRSLARAVAPNKVADEHEDQLSPLEGKAESGGSHFGASQGRKVV